MKTVLQRLIDSFSDYQHESQNNSIAIEILKDVIAKEYLGLEQEQIENAFEEGYEEKYQQKDFEEKYQQEINCEKPFFSNGLDYYTKTFKND